MKKLAVLMPTYNCAKYLQESIDSILNQTFQDFDLYIYDDFSTDNSDQIISAYDDKRVFYIKNTENLGIAKTLNLGLEKLLPHYEYIARMDADDWSFPKRFQKQIDFLEKNSAAVLYGTQGFWVTDLSKLPASGWQYPVDYNYIKLYLLFTASFGHSSLVLKSSFFLNNNLRYDETIKTCEDWDLWIKVSRKGEVYNLPDFLMKYRIVPTSNHRSSENKKIHLKERCVIISNYWKTFDINLSPEQVFEYYYDTDITGKDFYAKLNILIDSFNKLFLDHAKDLKNEDKKSFSYLLARKIADFKKRSNVTKYNLISWFIVLTKVKFISKTRLIKSQLN